MKKAMDILNELYAQEKELYEMNLPFEDKIQIYSKLVRKVTRTRRRAKLEKAIEWTKVQLESMKLFIRVIHAGNKVRRESAKMEGEKNYGNA